MLLFCIILGVSGFQLAEKKETTNQVASEMCGICITFNNLEFISKGRDWKAKEKVFEGEITEDKTIKFPGLEGYYVGKDIFEQNEYANNPYTKNPAVSVILSSIISDEGTTYVFEGTIKRAIERVYYLNKVYVREDGSYFTVLESIDGSTADGQSVSYFIGKFDFRRTLE